MPSALAFSTPRQQEEIASILDYLQNGAATTAEWLGNAVADPYRAIVKNDKQAQDRIVKKVAQAMTDPMAATFVPAKGAEVGAFSDLLASRARMARGGAPVTMREIADDAARQTYAGIGDLPRFPVQLPEALDHRQLYSEAPYLRDVDFKVNRNGTREGASYGHEISASLEAVPTITAGDMNWVSKGSDKPKGVLLHETQHAVQEHAGWPRGGSPADELIHNRMTEDIKTVMQPIAENQGKAWSSSVSALPRELRQLITKERRTQGLSNRDADFSHIDVVMPAKPNYDQLENWLEVVEEVVRKYPQYTKSLQPVIDNGYAYLNKVQEKLKLGMKPPSIDHAEDLQRAHQNYLNVHGEEMARRTARRMDKPLDERIGKPYGDYDPTTYRYSDTDVPNADDLIIRWGNGPAQMAPTPGTRYADLGRLGAKEREKVVENLRRVMGLEEPAADALLSMKYKLLRELRGKATP